MLGVRLPEDMNKRLEDLVKKTHRSKSYYVKEALASYLESYEEDLKAIATYEENLKNKTLKTYPLDDIKKRYDLD